ncbi:hypothetical protein PI124_g11590 [Phytophthora idaei]|nr:hypothetical protein PI125_g8027 [Phytophthora idaei]KAG3127239.1 hypothetical protein PI126_g21949 [Phytophthora idaei]KAG3243584.1 hypothetical protein PI124_g11590 [Phytophthora idaei]
MASAAYEVHAHQGNKASIRGTIVTNQVEAVFESFTVVLGQHVPKEIDMALRREVLVKCLDQGRHGEKLAAWLTA